MAAGVFFAIVLAGIAGCIMTALFANSIAGVPFGVVAGNWRKHLRSIIFALPIPYLLSMSATAGVFIAFMWLVLAPTIASKFYFGPKDVPVMTLVAFHTGYAVATLFAYVFVTRFLTMAGA